jgi:hypothetical protein
VLSDLQILEGLRLFWMGLLLHIPTANIECLFALLDMLRVGEFIQPLLPFVDLVLLFLGRRIIFLLSLIDSLVLLGLPQWRDVALYLRVDRLTPWLVLPVRLNHLFLNLCLIVSLFPQLLNFFMSLLMVLAVIYKDSGLFIESVDCSHLLLSVLECLLFCLQSENASTDLFIRLREFLLNRSENSRLL